MSLHENLKNRIELLAALKNEVLGPEPMGDRLEISPNIMMTWPEYQKPKMQMNGQEILWQEKPSKRYGTGVLYPLGSDLSESENFTSEVAPGADVDPEDKAIKKIIADIEKINSTLNDQDSEDDRDIAMANAYKPSAVGLSALVDLSSSCDLIVEVQSNTRLDKSNVKINPSGFYKKVKVLVGDSNTGQSYWMRYELLDQNQKIPSVSVSSEDLLNSEVIKLPLIANLKNLEINLISRKIFSKKSSLRLITITLINKNVSDGTEIDELALFQAGLSIRSNNKQKVFKPYPETNYSSKELSDPESDDRVNSLIYREDLTFAVGHGCAADWDSGRHDAVDSIWTDYLPVFETPSVSSELLVDVEGSLNKLKVSMRQLAGLEAGTGYEDLKILIDSYSKWIDDQTIKAKQISGENYESAMALVKRCMTCLERIKRGYNLITSDKPENASIKIAFRLANHAMLLSQVIGDDKKVRAVHYDNNGLQVWSSPLPNLGELIANSSRGYWRPFQIAFLLMSLEGIVQDNSPDRDIVDLIWFPTGGGKTEAYLGLTAFTLFYKAIIGEECNGTTVLMRYTLRLLTAQQFERASTLICAMEYLRTNQSPFITEKPFSIGLWVGRGSTPNTRDSARQLLRKLKSNKNSENPFVLLSCPWCGAKFGSVSVKGKSNEIHGYSDNGKTVIYRCPDEGCYFGGDPSKKNNARQHPISVIDEDLFDNPPSLLIGTVDKFALLAWQPNARKFFGIDDDGKRPKNATTLIIQDELHLISGPLGSMVAAYETVIEDLCTSDGMVKPKIIASTATISRATEQIRAIYGRKDSFLFPPSGLNSYDSFFSKEEAGPGRLYVGILPTGYGSLQTAQVRCFSSVLQNTTLIQGDPKNLDPWWTLLIFYNSIRELGGAATLFLSDIRERLRAILARKGLPYSQIRKIPNGVEELTSRIRNDEVPKILSSLQKEVESIDRKTNKVYPPDVVDVCLASNIIEVGVDVSRLSLMALVGQPKTTSQYIQVSSRVGRNPSKPGMVLMLYGQSKPRDRSHYEKFRTYHQKIYALVEPTSVTPFSPPAIDRALHGILVSLIRQKGIKALEGTSPKYLYDKNNDALIEEVSQIILNRVSAIFPEEYQSVNSKLERCLDQWRIWDPIEYGSQGNNSLPEHPSLLHPAGIELPESWQEHSWPTMSSMRNVDANCEAEVTDYYQLKRGDS